MLSTDTLQFLEDLKANNNRDWFLANKQRYEQYKKEYHVLIAEFLDAMRRKDTALKMLEVKHCTFRINRDIRFSKDKSPYKSHMGIWFNINQGHGNSLGYYIHIEKGASFAAGGMWMPEASELKKIRKEIAFFYEDLEEILNNKNFKKHFAGFNITEGNSLKTAPKDFEKDHPAIQYLKLKSFTVVKKIPDSDLFSAGFVKNTAEILATIKPLTVFLKRGLHSEEY